MLAFAGKTIILFDAPIRVGQVKSKMPQVQVKSYSKEFSFILGIFYHKWDSNAIKTIPRPKGAGKLYVLPNF
jgi:hypothetical protein